MNLKVFSLVQISGLADLCKVACQLTAYISPITKYEPLLRTFINIYAFFFNRARVHRPRNKVFSVV